MRLTVFRGEAVPVRERFDSWRTLVHSSHAPVDIWTDGNDDFRATHRLLNLGPVTVSELHSTPVRTRRTCRHIRQSDPELYFLSFIRAGGAAVQQHRTQGTAEPGETLFYSMSHAHEGRLAPGRPTQMVELILPRASLPVPSARLDRLLATRLPAGTGLGALLRDMVARISDDPSVSDPVNAPVLGRTVVDLTTSYLARAAAVELPPDALPNALLFRIRGFIERNLADPDLTPSSIAEAHHISLRTLHRLFRTTGVTVAAQIREARLERARLALADPALRAVPIREIAVSCGFPRPAEFTRAYRARFGRPPSDCRTEGAAA
ncbi:helix-turn-helix domain-containing protein [Streptomyces sp. NPDC006798]|uniref:AraC-like ligand-binding domain-containing protein n=1 Tax=Streptomyces sp. NPDC006798 TaxID=3155462 RepID=UPI0033C15BCE